MSKFKFFMSAVLCLFAWSIPAPAQTTDQVCPCWTDEVLQGIDSNNIWCKHGGWWAGEDKKGIDYSLMGSRNGSAEFAMNTGPDFCYYNGANGNSPFLESRNYGLSWAEYQACEASIAAEIKRRGLTCEF